MMKPIVVINPNSNEVVTSGLDKELEVYRLSGGPKIICVTNSNGPFGIESKLDSESVIPDIFQQIKNNNDAGAYVIACYSDPGVEALRDAIKTPIYGIAESGILTALSHGKRFGVIAISEGSISRHRAHIKRMGVISRLANERSLNMTVDQTAQGAHTFEKLVETGRKLLNDGADVLILGCAGMASHRSKLQRELHVPIIDPTQAAVSMAFGYLASQ